MRISPDADVALVECFRQFQLVIMAFLCTKCIHREFQFQNRVYQAVCQFYIEFICIFRVRQTNEVLNLERMNGLHQLLLVLY